MKSLEQQLQEASQRITALERENRSLRATLKTTDVAEHQVELVEAFQSLGLSEEQATIAARGR